MLIFLPRDLASPIDTKGLMERASLSERKRLIAQWASRQICDDMVAARQSSLYSEDRFSGVSFRVSLEAARPYYLPEFISTIPPPHYAAR